MPKIITIPKFTDDRGNLCVIEKLLPFEIKRVYFISNGKGTRGGHRHKKTIQALICLSGSCRIDVQSPQKNANFSLTQNNQCLLLEPEDWHTMSDFSTTATLLVLASEYYDKNDYINTPYR